MDAFRVLPGVGPKTAQRMAMHLLERERPGGQRLAEDREPHQDSTVDRVGACEYRGHRRHVHRAEREHRQQGGRPGRALRVGRRAWSWWDILECGGLRVLSGLKLAEIAHRIGAPETVVWRRLRVHEEAMRIRPDYLEGFRRLFEAAWRTDHAAIPA